MISAKQKQVSFGTGKFLQGRRIAYKRMFVVRSDFRHGLRHPNEKNLSGGNHCQCSRP